MPEAKVGMKDLFKTPFFHVSIIAFLVLQFVPGFFTPPLSFLITIISWFVFIVSTILAIIFAFKNAKSRAQTESSNINTVQK